MCFPGLPAVMAGLAVASGGAQYLGARQQAKTQAKYQAQASAAERQRFQQEQTSMRMRQAQEQEAVGRELEQVSKKSQAALARARVSAGEAGVAGASVQALMSDYMRQEAGYRAALLRQQEMGGLATGLGLEQAGFATRQRQIGINQPISRPSGYLLLYYKLERLLLELTVQDFRYKEQMVGVVAVELVTYHQLQYTYGFSSTRRSISILFNYG